MGKSLIILLLFVNLSIAQSSIVASGNSNITIGDNFGIMRSDMNEKEVSLGVPKFETPIETPKPKPKPIKKKSLFEKILDFIKKLINKKQ